VVKRKTSSEKGFRRRLIIKNPKNRPRDTAVGLFLGGLLVSRGRKGRLNAWCSIFCFKYGKKHDGREGIDGFRRPLHFASSSYLIGKDGAELETWDRGVCLRTEGGVQLKTV